MNVELQTLWSIYGSTSDSIRFADTKASAVMATLTVAISVVMPNVPKFDVLLQLPIFILLLGSISVVAGIVSFYFAVRSLLPASSVQATDAGSLIFFGQIAHY